MESALNYQKKKKRKKRKDISFFIPRNSALYIYIYIYTRNIK